MGMVRLEFGSFSTCWMPTAIVSPSEFKARTAQMLAAVKTTEKEIVLTQPRGPAGPRAPSCRISMHQRSGMRSSC